MGLHKSGDRASYRPRGMNKDGGIMGRRLLLIFHFTFSFRWAEGVLLLLRSFLLEL